MTASAIVRDRRPWPSVGRRWVAHPERGYVLVVAAAWAAVLASAASVIFGPGLGLRPPTAGMRDAFLCLVGGPADAAPITASGVLVAGLGRAAGTVAMMGLLVTPVLHHVAVTSLPARRWRNQALIAAAFLGTWIGLVWLADPVLAVARGVVGRDALVLAALGTALVWQHSRVKAAGLRACHRVVPLAPRGRRADLGGLALGWATARTCVSTCGPFMLLALAVESGMVAMALFTAVPLLERARRRPDPRLGSATLIVVAIIALAGARLA